MKVYLDDERQTPEDWIRTYTVDETIVLLQTNKVTELSLDNDLGIPGSENEGYQVVRWLESVCNPDQRNDDYNPMQMIPIVYVHSGNSNAAKDMAIGIEKLNRWRK